MGIAKIYNQKQSGLGIRGIIEDYYVYAGEKVSAGDFVEFINGVAGKTTETSSDTFVSDVTNAGYLISATKLDDTRIFITHGGGDTDTNLLYLYGVVCTINGAKITAGVDTQLNSSIYSGAMHLSTVALEENKVFIAHRYGSSGNLTGTICTISDTTITVSSSTKLIRYSSSAEGISCVKLAVNKVFVAYGYNSYLYGVICTVNNNTISINTDTGIQLSTTVGTSEYISTTGLDENRIFIAYRHSNSYNLYAQVCTISGTTITKGTEKQLTSTTYSGYVISTTKIDNNRVFVAHNSSTLYYLYGLVCEIDETIINPGVDNMLDSQNSTAQRLATILVDADKIFLVHTHTQNQFYLCARVCSISGNTITNGARKTLINETFSASGLSAIFYNNSIFLAHSHTNAYHLYAQLFGVDEASSIPTNQIVINEYETQVRKATTSDIYGVAKTSGTGGDSSEHKDKVSIYTIDTSITLAELPVGTLVKDTSSTFLGEPVIWKIADVNHEGYPDNSVTLISDKIVAMRCFDAKEPNNSNSNRVSAGNDRYSVSNIRQWLNSDAGAGMWYSAQHSADAPPSSSYVWQKDSVAVNPYDTKAGFLNSFSQNFKNALLETNLTVALSTVTDGGGSEIVTDKMFLASNIEVGFENENNIAEGALLSIFNNDINRIGYCTTEAINDSNYSNDPANDTTAWYWWLRTPKVEQPGYACTVSVSDILSNSSVYGGIGGIRPLCNLPSSIKVSKDEDGIYKLDF